MALESLHPFCSTTLLSSPQWYLPQASKKRPGDCNCHEDQTSWFTWHPVTFQSVPIRPNLQISPRRPMALTSARPWEKLSASIWPSWTHPAAPAVTWHWAWPALQSRPFESWQFNSFTSASKASSFWLLGCPDPDIENHREAGSQEWSPASIHLRGRQSKWLLRCKPFPLPQNLGLRIALDRSFSGNYLYLSIYLSIYIYICKNILSYMIIYRIFFKYYHILSYIIRTTRTTQVQCLQCLHISFRHALSRWCQPRGQTDPS